MWPEKIHNHIIDEAFGKILSKEKINILKAASIYVDEFQDVSFSYMHAMRTGEQSASESRELMANFINNNMNEYKKYMSMGNEDVAYWYLGQALHPLMDMTSPSHEGYQIWMGIINEVIGGGGGIEHYQLEQTITDEILGNTIKILQGFFKETTGKKMTKDGYEIFKKYFNMNINNIFEMKKNNENNKKNEKK